MRKVTIEEIIEFFARCSQCEKAVVFLPLGDMCDECEAEFHGSLIDSLGPL